MIGRGETPLGKLRGLMAAPHVTDPQTYATSKLRKNDLMDTCISSDRARFLRAWLQNPLKIASVTPSSQSLAQLITSEIGPDTGHVIELGAGTGVFTRELIGRGVREEDITLIEQDVSFIAMLNDRFPRARVLNLDASNVDRLQGDGGRFGAAVSGLPLLSMSPRKVMAILSASFRAMDGGGRFYQFTYGPRCPVPRAILDRLGLKAVRIGRTPWNLPPAAVYRISRRRRLP